MPCAYHTYDKCVSCGVVWLCKSSEDSNESKLGWVWLANLSRVSLMYAPYCDVIESFYRNILKTTKRQLEFHACYHSETSTVIREKEREIRYLGCGGNAGLISLWQKNKLINTDLLHNYGKVKTQSITKTLKWITERRKWNSFKCTVTSERKWSDKELNVFEYHSLYTESNNKTELWPCRL